MKFNIVHWIISFGMLSCWKTCALTRSAWLGLSHARYSTTRYAASRSPAGLLTLDSHLCSTNLPLVLDHLLSRHADPNFLDEVKELPRLYEEKKSFMKAGDTARSHRKSISKEIGKAMKEGNAAKVDELKALVDESNEAATRADSQQESVTAKIDSIVASLPNLLDDRVPDGESDANNVVIHTWGEDKRKVGDGYLWHDEIARRLGCFDPDSAVKLSGARFSVLLGPLARLERALSQFCLDFHISRGYNEVSVPLMVRRSVLQGTGQLPKFEEDLFKVNHKIGDEDCYLIPTAEVPLTNLFREQIMEVEQLPLKMVALSPCFRAEAGSHGRDTRGLLRQHQFHKVELVNICSPESSKDMHEALVRDAEGILEALDLPYRRVLLCSGDTGFSARICYDLEVWLPGQQEYREISSCSNCYDFQSRRMMMRYRHPDKSRKEMVYPHTLNGSGVAIGRALVAILENYQQPDGSVLVPKALQPYLNGLERLLPCAAASTSS